MNHFELLRDRTNEALFEALRGCFDRPGRMAAVVAREVFLRPAPARRRCGRRRCSCSGAWGARWRLARRLAQEVIAAEDEGLRHAASVVLGWEGTE